jgi:hypothetical protein
MRRSGAAGLRNSAAYAWIHDHDGDNRENSTGESRGEEKGKSREMFRREKLLGAIWGRGTGKVKTKVKNQNQEPKSKTPP